MTALATAILLGPVATTWAAPDKKKPKMVESSRKRKPDWVNTLRKDYLIVVGTGASIEASQQQAMVKVREAIAKSVAEHVTVTTTTTTREEMGGAVANYFQSFEMDSRGQTAEMDFLKGISPSKAEDFYWEAWSDGGPATYHYHLMYPYSELENRKLVMAFEKADRELTRQLDDILERIDQTTVVEEMQADLATLERLAPRFVDARKAKAEIGAERLRGRLRSINVATTRRTPSRIEYELRIGRQTVTTNRKPTATNPTKCATINAIEPAGQGWAVDFDARYCYDDPANLIRVTHQFVTGKMQHDFRFGADEGKVQLSVVRPVVVEATRENATTVEAGRITVVIHNKFDGAFTVGRVLIKWPGQQPLLVDAGGAAFSGKGEHTLELALPQPLDKRAYAATATTLLDGELQYTNAADGLQGTCALTQIGATTTW